MANEHSRFTLANYNNDGEQIGVSQVMAEELESRTVAGFKKILSKLSGDLELPLEAELPGPIAHIDFRVGSDLNGAYVLYYLHDEVVFASLFLRGQDLECETELTQVFKFLLLDTEDLDEPTEDEIDEVLASSAFDFPAITERPAAFNVRLSSRPEDSEICQHIDKMDQHLAAAFLLADDDQRG